MATRRRAASERRTERVKNIVPDAPDFRDRLYIAPVHSRPPPQLPPRKSLPVLDQESTNACTGFALASVVHWLLKEGDPAPEEISPFMLYSMARRYDEFRGADADTGSSLRGALKGWHKHGACHAKLWPALQMPRVPIDPTNDWWIDAVRRPLGAYYRIEPTMIPDMHVALDEIGILYASAVCHAGWDEGDRTQGKALQYWEIPRRPATVLDGGHAFVIVGYDERGFVIQNSWGERWGSGGLARLTDQDWRENAMDCWVVQMGVVTALHLAVATAPTLRLAKGKVELAAEERLRNHELAPFIVDMENDGALSTSGDFRTNAGDLKALVSTYLDRARSDWGLAPSDPVDIAVYAHGGLVSEAGAANAAARWIPALYENRIFPVFFMWETDLFKTLENIAKELVLGEPRRTAGMQRWWNERIEKLLAGPGTAIWSEIKENAQLITGSAQGGGMILYKAATASPSFNPRRDRIHLIGHSAGSVVHAYLVDALVPRGWKFQTVNFMAPAARVDLFDAKLLPHIKSGKVAQYNQWHLSDALERADSTCRAILGYGRSLLYLVSQACEGGAPTPLVGMQVYFEGIRQLGIDNVKVYTAQCADSAATTHGAFDDDEVTIRSVIRRIKASWS
jgi:hypothetical protein